MDKGKVCQGNVGRNPFGRARLRRAVKGRLNPAGGRYPARQLTFQPEAVEAMRQNDLPVEALDAKGSCQRISERGDHNEN